MEVVDWTGGRWVRPNVIEMAEPRTVVRPGRDAERTRAKALAALLDDKPSLRRAIDLSAVRRNPAGLLGVSAEERNRARALAARI